MRRTALDRFLPAVLSIGLALGLNLPVLAQEGPGGSSGSGEGTGAGGTMGGVQRNQSGSMSGSGPGSFGGLDPGPFPVRRIPSDFRIPAGPGIDVTFPDDPGLVPFLTLGASGGPDDGKTPTTVTSDILKNARAIHTPSERCLAFQLIAKGAIYSNQFSIAHKALEEAAASALQEPVPLTHDLRLMAIITTYANLTDAVIREGHTSSALGFEPEPEPGASPEALPKRLEGTAAIRLARLEWSRAAYLAQMIHNPTNRSEMLYRVTDSQAAGSIEIARRYGKSVPTLEAPENAQPAASEEDPATFRKLADEVLEDATAVAGKIERPVWKGKSLIRIAVGAADSLQYDRGLKVARSIADPEYRTEALLFIAESQCRLAERLPESSRRLNYEATQTYTDVAEAVADIRQMGLRGVGVGFLIDSLISVGRFDDARACITLYPERYQQFVALGAIAESQGRRGSADAAREWIARETPDEYKPTLYRRVTRGLLGAIEQNRSQENLRNDLGP